MNKFTIRLTKKYTPEGFSWDEKLFPNTFMVLETDATNEHYQGLIVTDQKAITIRKKLEVLAPEAVGNKAISIKDCSKDKTYHGDVDRYIIYLCKGTKDAQPQVVLNTAGVLDVVEKWKQYWITNEELKASSKKEKKEQLTQVEKIFQEYPVILNDNNNDYILCVTSVVQYKAKHLKPWTYQQIANFALAWLDSKSEARQKMTIQIVVADILKRTFHFANPNLGDT